MTLTAGTITQVAVGPNYTALSVTAASGGTGPYANQWHKSTTTGFTPSTATAIAGATDLTLDDSSVSPNTPYFYKVVQTDTGNSNAPITTSQLAVTTSAAANPNLNQFRMSKVIGMARLLPNNNTVSVQVDAAQSGSLVAGQFVKLASTLGGTPKVVAVAANTDNAWGVINLDPIKSGWIAGQALEVSREGNIVYLVSTGAIARGSAVTLDTSVIGGVAQATTSSGFNVVGEAYDGCTAAGTIIGVKLKVASFQYA